MSTFDDAFAEAHRRRMSGEIDPRAHALARTSPLSAIEVHHALTYPGVTLRVSSLAEGLSLKTRCEWALVEGRVLLVTAAEMAAIEAAAVPPGAPA